MAKNTLFRSSLSGFNKDDVNSYIKETDMKHQEELSSLRGEYDSKITALSEGNAHLIEEMNLAKETADSAKSELVELTKNYNFYRAECEAQINVIATLREEIAALKNELEEAKNAPAEPDLDKEHKVGMYDQISSQVGDILINANRNADTILAGANEEADRIKADAEAERAEKMRECDAAVAKTRQEVEEEARYIRDRISETANFLLNNVSEDLHNNVDSCIREITTAVSDMQYEIKALLSKLSGRSSEMSERIDYYQTSIVDGIEEKLKEMDDKYGIDRFTGKVSENE